MEPQYLNVAPDAERLLRAVDNLGPSTSIRNYKGDHHGQKVYSEMNQTIYEWIEQKNAWLEVARAHKESDTTPYKPKLHFKDTEENIKEKIDIFEKTLNNET